MGQIVCFGDSNTWGLRPGIGNRFESGERWTGILKNSGHNIVEEGLNGRTANEVDEDEPYLNGRNYSIACILSHRPIDILIVMLGTNDVKSRYGKTAEQIADSVYQLTKDMGIRLSQSQAEKFKVLLVSPKGLDSRILGDGTFDEESIKKSHELGELLAKKAELEDWIFFNANIEEITLGVDGLHLSKEGHAVLADKLSDIIKNNND